MAGTMSRGTYMTGSVAEFRDWLAGRLEGEPIDFPQLGGPAYASLREAFEHYAWPDRRRAALPKPGHPYRFPVLPSLAGDSTFTQNEEQLQRLQKVLRRAYQYRPINRTRLAGAVAAILYWGGVYTEPHLGGGNRGWLAISAPSLHEILERVVSAVQGGSDVYEKPGPLHFTAGTTKVYALLLDDFIIYDSRVASSLAWLVKQWWMSAIFWMSCTVKSRRTRSLM